MKETGATRRNGAGQESGAGTALRRRAVLGGIAMTAIAARASAETTTLPFGNGERPIVSYPQKRPMIGLTARPP